MSATPEQIAVGLDEFAGEQEAKSALEWLASMSAAYLNEAKQLRAAAALIRAQAERVRVLESALEQIAACHIEYSESHAACYGPPILSAEQMAATAFATLALHRAALKAAP